MLITLGLQDQRISDMKCGFHLISVTVYLEKTVEIKLSHE